MRSEPDLCGFLAGERLGGYETYFGVKTIARLTDDMRFVEANKDASCRRSVKVAPTLGQVIQAEKERTVRGNVQMTWPSSR